MEETEREILSQDCRCGARGRCALYNSVLKIYRAAGITRREVVWLASWGAGGGSG